MIVNFKSREISWGARKLAWTFILIINKKMKFIFILIINKKMKFSKNKSNISCFIKIKSFYFLFKFKT
jgi:hypothetical protein